MGRPKITTPAPPPIPPMIPSPPVYGRTEEEKLKRQMRDPKRVGRSQTIKTGPQGLLSKTRRKKLGSGDTPKNT